MKPEITRNKRTSLSEIAATVFKPVGESRYKAVKSRHGDIIIDAEYSEYFVKAYAMENVDVYIEDGGR